jgi:hypothetical protein
MAHDDRWRDDRDRGGHYDDERRRLEEVRRAYGATDDDRSSYRRTGREDWRGPGRYGSSESDLRGWDEGRDVRDRDGFWGRGRGDGGFSSERGRRYSREDCGSTGHGPDWGRELRHTGEVGRGYDDSGWRRGGFREEPQGRGFGYRSDFPRNDRDDGGRENFGTLDRAVFERATDEVSSWFANRDAERRREQDHRGRGPRGYRRSDSRIQEDINDRLADDPYVDASDIDVSASNGEVTLSGTVDSRHARRRAEDLIERVSGVSYVQNNLRVRHLQSGTGTSAAYGTGSAGDPTASAGKRDDTTAGMGTATAGFGDKSGTNGDRQGSVS